MERVQGEGGAGGGAEGGWGGVGTLLLLPPSHPCPPHT